MKKMNVLWAFMVAAMVTACVGNTSEASEASEAAVRTESGGPGVTQVEETELVETQKPETQKAETQKPETQKPDTQPSESLDDSSQNSDVMRIEIQGNGHTVVFELNDSPAARSLYSQLPLSVEVENYGNNEKIFSPPEGLETDGTPFTAGGGEGGLAYFAPWNNVVLYYGSFGPYSGLYDLGTAISGSEWIEELTGEITIE